MHEPHITINGTRLSEAQVMTIRVAVGAYLMETDDPDMLGEDEHGRSMTKAYRDRLLEIYRLFGECT